MRTLLFGFYAILCPLAIADTAIDGVQLYLDPETGEVSSKKATGHIPVGTYVSAQVLMDQQSAMTQQLRQLQTRLERLEAREDGTGNATAVVSEVVKPGSDSVATVQAQTPADAIAVHSRYERRKLRWRSVDGRYSVGLQNRAQMRYSTPFDDSPRDLAGLDENDSSYALNRIRTILSGTVIDPRLAFHIEHDWNESVIRDFFLTLKLGDSTSLWVGRSKALYNTEFWISSGRQQFVERTIAHDLFTANRQQGAQLFGRLFAGSPADLSYTLGIFNGRGGTDNNNDDDFLYTSRLQWNALGGPIARAHSDLAFSRTPQVNIAIAALTNRSDCTRFGSGANSCRSLPGFTPSDQAQEGQFDVEQTMAELRVRWNGFSLEGELNRKRVIDRILDLKDPRRRTTLEGGFIQAGLLPHGLFPAVPPQLEFGLRYASVDRGDYRGSDDAEEISGVANWYIDGHENKLSLEFSRIDLEDPLLQMEGSENRLRLQWDVRF